MGCLERDIEKIVKVFFKILEKRSQNIQEQQKSRFLIACYRLNDLLVSSLNLLSYSSSDKLWSEKRRQRGILCYIAAIF